jgi:hypothetical protein
MSGRAAFCPELCVRVGASVCLCVWCLFIPGHLFPFFLLLNIMIHSSPPCSRKKDMFKIVRYTLHLHLNHVCSVRNN